MRRIDFNPAPPEAVPTTVQISATPAEITRLLHGVTAFDARLRALRSYGVETLHDPDAVRNLGAIMLGALVRDTPRDGLPQEETVTINSDQAALLHHVAVAMSYEACAEASTRKALAWDGVPRESREDPHPAQIWAGFALELAPPAHLAAAVE